MTTRTVTGTLYHLDGTAWAGGAVTFTLLETFENGTTVYPQENHTETLDASGQFTITLAVPDTGTAPYEIHTPDGLGYRVNLGAGAATDLVTLLTIATSVVSQSALQTLLDANNVMTVREVTSTDSIVASDEYIRASGTFTLSLPAATGSKVMYVVKNASTGTITVARAGTDMIDGSTSKAIDALENRVFFDAADGEWDVI